jgi:DNA polymerase-3 subunit beta
VVGFNSQYLIDFLKATGNTGEVRLEFKDAQSAGQMRPEDGNEDVAQAEAYACAKIERTFPYV